jgi:hypothetical protein
MFPLPLGRGVGGRSSLWRTLLFALVVFISLAGSDRAQAHQTILIGSEGLERATATHITDADIAWAVWGALPEGATQHLAFVRPASGMFRARVLVPTRQANLQLNPWLALVGPGLERPAGLEGVLREGEGAILVPPPESRELEMFQDVPFPVIAGASFETPLPADGPYYLLVFDPSGQGGSYLIDTGYLQD